MYFQPSLCFYVYVDSEFFSKVCGMRDLSTDTKLVLHTFTKNNYLPPIVDNFNPYSTKAHFRNVILPPAPSAYCRYGDPFRGGENPIIQYEIGIGSSLLATNLVPYRKMISPCLPCYNLCSRYNCNSTCDAAEHVLYEFMMDGFYLPSTKVENNETITATYFTTGGLHMLV